MEEKELSLRSLFLDAKRHEAALEMLDSRSGEFKERQTLAVRALESCHNIIIQIGLYSTNEELDDISTQDLEYLTVDYQLADLLLKAYDADRLAQLKRASELLEAFLVRLDHYDILSSSQRAMLERYQGNRKLFSLVSATSAEERRKAKVARFQEEKALKTKLKLLRDQSSTNHVDDEIRRNLYLTEVGLDIHETFQSLDMISQELSILSQIHQMVPPVTNGAGEDDRRRRDLNSGYSDRLDGPATIAGLGRGPLLDSKGKPLQPFTLTDKRTQLQKGVFRPGHNLPTMSIDEYLEEERKRGGIIEGGGNANVAQAEPDEDNMELVDAATYKAREWDAFVEANPKGSGNTINRG